MHKSNSPNPSNPFDPFDDTHSARERESELPLPIFLEAELPEPIPSFTRRLFRAGRDVLETVVPAIVIALLINLFLAQATRVYGQSMEPNLHTDQRLVVEKISYNFHSPHVGDVVVLRVTENSEDLLIKRVIALAGQTVEIKDGRVHVDGEVIQEEYLNQETWGNHGPIYVPPLHVFVLGDNRSASNDSRSFGSIHSDQIVGRAWYSYWPLEEWGPVE